MEKKTFTVVSDYDNLLLHGSMYAPKGEKKGIVQIAHGMCEFRERYEEFMEFLCKNGYVAVCHDHRGHGDSVEKEADLGWFRDFDGKAVVDDCVKVTRYIKEGYPDLPVILFGHSMGSMIVRCYIQNHDDLIDKLIVCGSPSQNSLVGVAIFMTKCIRLFRGQRYRSKLLSYLSVGNGNDKFPGEEKGAWLTRDRSAIEKYYGNPKGRYGFTCNGFENLFKLMKRTYQKKRYALKNPTLPIHFVAGSDDPVIKDELKWFKAIESLRSVGYENVTGKLYEGMRHEIFNEFGKEGVYEDLLTFIRA